jgi:hypothetical protein
VADADEINALQSQRPARFLREPIEHGLCFGNTIVDGEIVTAEEPLAVDVGQLGGQRAARKPTRLGDVVVDADEEVQRPAISRYRASASL